MPGCRRFDSLAGTQIEFRSLHASPGPCSVPVPGVHRLPLRQPVAQPAGKHGDRVVVIVGHHQGLAIVRNRYSSDARSYINRRIYRGKLVIGYRQTNARRMSLGNGEWGILPRRVLAEVEFAFQRPNAGAWILCDDVDVVAIVGEWVRDGIGAIRSVSHAAGHVESMIRHNGIPNNPMIRIGDLHGLLEDRRVVRNVVDKHIFIRILRIEEWERTLKHPVEPAG